MKKLNIGLLGYGTVGKGVEFLLKNERNMSLHAIFRRAGKANGPLMTDQIDQVIANPQIDTIVEAMGGLEPAHGYLRKALLNHKNVITANKALVNAFGQELNQLALQNNVSFVFSAACGGGIPFLPTMVDTLKDSSIQAVGGILNGTTNFIIDKMEREALPFEDALKQAQDLGYAEADPTGDLNGTDTSYKLRLALAVSNRVWVDQNSILVAGIQNLKAEDIKFFNQKQWVLRLLAHGEKGESLSAVVEPTLLGSTSEEAKILENNNLAWFKTTTDKITVLTGQGAGSLPTATNVVRDLKAIQNKPQTFLSGLMKFAFADNDTDQGSYYVRTNRSIKSNFLDQHAQESWEEGPYLYTITRCVKTLTIHQEVKKLSQQGEVFFAKIAE